MNDFPYYQEKTRISFLTTPNFCNKARKRNLEREREREREIILFLLANNMILIFNMIIPGNLPKNF